MSTLQATNLKHGSSASNNLVLDANGNVTAAGTVAMASSFAMRNKIINGAMEIDQRNAGAAVTINGNFVYPVDRVLAGGVGSGGTFTSQQSSTSVSGFPQSLIATTGTADASIASGDYYFPYLHRIEGYNTADLGWGAAGAKSITVSFWVRSNVTGTYPVAVRNSASDRSYVTTFAISSANTFEYKSVTIPGDTSGTWLTNNGTGIQLSIGAIAGSSSQATVNTWSAGNFYSTSACTNWMATTGNTFYLTAVQLEVGSVATPFERRLYPQELAMCQRYYEKSYDTGVAVGTNLNNTIGGFVGAVDPNPALNAITGGSFKVTKRTAATISIWSQLGVSNQTSGWQDNGVTRTVTALSNNTLGIEYLDLSAKPERLMRFQWAASAEL